jgi:hypothetical protein
MDIRSRVIELNWGWLLHALGTQQRQGEVFCNHAVWKEIAWDVDVDHRHEAMLVRPRQQFAESSSSPPTA